MICKSKRLHVKKLQQKDLQNLHNLQSSLHVMRFIDTPRTFAQNKEELQKIQAQYEQQKPDILIYGVFTLLGEFVGTCALILYQKDKPSIGYRLLKKHWNKGYGSELAKALIHYTCSAFAPQKLFAYVDTDNTASIKILQKNGFVFTNKPRTKEKEAELMLTCKT